MAITNSYMECTVELINAWSAVKGGASMIRELIIREEEGENLLPLAPPNFINQN
jgi:hypothetical protein